MSCKFDNIIPTLYSKSQFTLVAAKEYKILPRNILEKTKNISFNSAWECGLRGIPASHLGLRWTA